MYANKSTILTSTIRQVQAADRKSILVEADRDNGWLRINRNIFLNLSDGLAKSAADWRPCVVVSGGCVVTIEDWPVSDRNR
jgi:hypothetical protein